MILRSVRARSMSAMFVLVLALSDGATAQALPGAARTTDGARPSTRPSAMSQLLLGARHLPWIVAVEVDAGSPPIENIEGLPIALEGVLVNDPRMAIELEQRIVDRSGRALFPGPPMPRSMKPTSSMVERLRDHPQDFEVIARLPTLVTGARDFPVRLTEDGIFVQVVLAGAGWSRKVVTVRCPEPTDETMTAALEFFQAGTSSTETMPSGGQLRQIGRISALPFSFPLSRCTNASHSAAASVLGRGRMSAVIEMRSVPGGGLVTASASVATTFGVGPEVIGVLQLDRAATGVGWCRRPISGDFYTFPPSSTTVALTDDSGHILDSATSVPLGGGLFRCAWPRTRAVDVANKSFIVGDSMAPRPQTKKTVTFTSAGSCVIDILD